MEYTSSSRSMSFPAALISISFSEVSGTLRAHTRMFISISTSCCLQFLFPSFMDDLLVHQFGQIRHRHLAFQARHLDRIFYIHHAERTGRHDHTRPCFRGHSHSEHAHPLLFFRFVEQHESAATAAEGPVARSLHFHSLYSRNSIEHTARVVIDLVVSSQVAGVVVGVDILLALKRTKLDVAGLYFPGDHLADVLDGRDIFIV